MRTIHVTIREDKMVPDSVDAGHEMDNLITQLSITIPSDWDTGYAYRLRFRTARQAIGEVYVSDRLQPNPSGDYVFPLPSGVLIEGLLHIQIEGTDTTTDKVMHTAVMVLTVGKSLRGDEDQGVPPNYSGLIDQTMSEMQATFNEMTSTLAHMDTTLDEMDSTLVVDAESARQSAASAAVVAEDRAAVEQVFAQATEDFRGPPGKDGQNGADGAPGPNVVSTTTGTDITGLLKGNGANVSKAVAGADYATPAQLDDKLSKNGGVMTGNISGPGASGIVRIGYPNQIGEMYALRAYLNKLEMLGDILPNTTAARNLGSNAYRWNYVYGGIGNFSTQVAVDGNAIVSSGDGASDTGRYVKMYDGTMICYHSKTVSVDITRPYDALYFGYGPAWTYPQTYTSAPVVVATLDDNNLISATASGADTSKILGTYIYGTKSISSYSLKIRFVAIGRWK